MDGECEPHGGVMRFRNKKLNGKRIRSYEDAQKIIAETAAFYCRVCIIELPIPMGRAS